MTTLLFNHQLSKPSDQMHMQFPMVVKNYYDHLIAIKLS